MTAIQLPTGARGARILGLGAYRPRRRVTNHDLAQMMDTNDEWIQSRVGIAERRWASEDETLVEMAVAAGGKAIAASGLAPDEIDLVIVASASLRAPDPGHRPAGRLQARHPAPGVVRPQRRLRRVLLRAGRRERQHRRRLLAQRAGGRGRAAHRRHQPGGPDDGGDLRRRRRCGRGGASDEPGIGPVAWGSDGDQYNAIEIAAGSSTMTMAGQAVYRWATTKLTETLVEAMEKAGVGPADIDVFAPHQANLRIVESMTKRLGFPESTVIARDIVVSGNTSAASVPLALTALLESGEAQVRRPGARPRLRRRPDVRGSGARHPVSPPRSPPSASGHTVPFVGGFPVRSQSPIRERGPSVSREDIQSGLAEILEEVAGVTPADATPEKSFTDDLDVDSLSMVEIATAVEDKFGVAIPDDELGNIKTVGDAVSFIEKNQG